MYGFFFAQCPAPGDRRSSSATANGIKPSQSLTAAGDDPHRAAGCSSAPVGVAVLVAGVMMAKEAWTKEFLKVMDLTAAPTGTRSLVEKLGLVGGIARGAVIVLAGVFLVIAAIRFSPSQAEGIDGTLRAFAHTPLGPVLLILVALGLIAFGLFSCCEARWRRV